ncbi:MAG: hypothetical protein M1461_01365 [Nitrospirae bacterium]|nr:hypothetical protein [Nitrospirota bacterium]
MKQCDLPIATAIYDCSKKAEIEKYAITHKEFRGYCLYLKKFEHLLGENAEDPYWKAFLSPLKRYRFELSAAPLFFNGAPSQTLHSIRSLKNIIDRCKYLFPQFAEPAQDIFTQISSLIELYENPIMDFLSSHIISDGGSETAILLKESYLIPLAEATVKSQRQFQKVDLLAPVQLKGGKCYQNVFVIGPGRWFPSYVFTAPRALKIMLVRYGWIKEPLQLDPVFICSRDTVSGPAKPVRIAAHAAEEEYLSSEDLIPKIDWGSISKRATGHISKDESQEEVDARLFLLEGEKAVFLDAEDNSSILIIDLDEEDQFRVKRIPVNDIYTNMYVLLRTSGGGDYIINVADWIMGKEAEGARMMQKLWKDRLRDAARSSSLLELSLKLIDLGSIRANEVNVRNWMSYKSIRTSDYHDFDAIMKLVGLADRAKECWDIMGMIDSAHRKAGQHIRKLLLKKVQEADLNELQRIGRMDFGLEEVDSGSLTAFRVRNVSSEIMKVAVSLLGHPFDVKDALWQG